MRRSLPERSSHHAANGKRELLNSTVGTVRPRIVSAIRGHPQTCLSRPTGRCRPRGRWEQSVPPALRFRGRSPRVPSSALPSRSTPFSRTGRLAASGPTPDAHLPAPEPVPRYTTRSLVYTRNKETREPGKEPRETVREVWEVGGSASKSKSGSKSKSEADRIRSDAGSGRSSISISI